MHFEGVVDVASARDRVWSFVSDPARVAGCAPDVEHLEVVDPTHFRVTVRAGIGPIRTTFVVEAEFTELRANERAAVRAIGHARGSVVEMSNVVELSDAAEGRTTLRWSAEVNVSGAIANIGSRFMQAAADKTTRDVFACLKQRLESP
ncbi:MAG: carbon monoxide dehydrogenase subunit G [Chloroflexota bacterium]